MADNANIIRPQDGYQMKVLSSPADIVIGGSGAGVGKTFSLLMDFLRGIHNPQYGGVIFRRTTPQITNEGGLWDESEELFSLIPHSLPLPSQNSWRFESGAKLKFSHLEYEKDKLNWQGSQICFIGFDELTHFTESQFFYLLSRNRSTCGIRPFVRATCNPDSESWVARLIEWWICQDETSSRYGYPIPEREGKLRYFVKQNSVYIWGDTKEEVIAKCPDISALAEKTGTDVENYVKSLTFISGDIYDNKKLLSKDPTYLANLMALDEQEKESLMRGNWKVTISGNNLFDYFAVKGIDSNFIEQEDENGFVSCDVAGEGEDKAFIYGWKGLKVKTIRILTKCTQPDLEKEIEIVREYIGATKSNTVCDADGIGTGVVQYGSYRPFKNNSSPIDPIQAKSDANMKANYQNLKTQCYYLLAEKIENGEVSLQDCEIFVDGKKTNKISVKGKGDIEVVQYIKEDLLSIKKIKPGSDEKKKINSKEEQKEILGRSPDGGDGMMMRMIFILDPKRKSHGVITL